MQKFTMQDVQSLANALVSVADEHGFMICGSSRWVLEIADRDLPLVVTACGPGRDDSEGADSATPFIRTVDETVAELNRLRDWYAKEIL